jgi:hypothetical protein
MSACLACSPGCSACTSASVCTQCQSGFDLVDNLCVQSDPSPNPELPWWAILLIVNGGLLLGAVAGTPCTTQLS